MDDNDKRNSAASFGAEGTEELDQAALLAHLEEDSQHTLQFERVEPGDPREPTAVPYRRSNADTVASPAVPATTVPETRARPGPTVHRIVPDALLARAQRDEDDESLQVPAARYMPTIPIEAVIHDAGEGTSTFSTRDVLEFDAVIDGSGRVALPSSAVAGRFKPGAMVRIVAVPSDDAS